MTYTFYYTLGFDSFAMTSKYWNKNFIVRANGHAMSLRKFYEAFGVNGLARFVHYANKSTSDNCRIRINGVTVYVHFK